MVEVLPGKGDDPVRAKLRSIRLDMVEETKLVYHALSYAWSSEERDFTIILNEKPVNVTKQLGEFFREVRNELSDNKTWCWWIDQVCINQDDDDDKAQQIPHMRAIYEMAVSTVVYLKPSVEDGDLAIDLILRLISLSRRPDSGYVLDHLSLSEILGPSNEDNLRSWHALQNFMSHKYWTRMWILPEATAHTDKCVVMCVNFERGLYLHQVFWIRNLLLRLVTRHPPPEYLIHAIPSSPVGRVSNFGFLRTTPKAATLFDFLYLARRTECSRPEDKIFAMLQFATDVGDYMNDRFLRPDYSQGSDRTCLNLIMWYLLKYQNLDFLGYCTATKSSIAQVIGFNLRSWVPNWTHASFMKPLPKYCEPQASIEDRVPLYSACGQFSGSIDIDITSVGGDAINSLVLSGLYIATLHKVLEPAVDGGFWEPEAETSWRHEFDDNLKYPLTTESCLDAFERTVVADITRDFSSGRRSRPGRASWRYDNEEMSTIEKHDLSHNLTDATGDRRLFFARSCVISSSESPKLRLAMSGESLTRLGTDCGSCLMGLGRCDVEVGDEVWALQGGQVLYVLRRVSDDHMLADETRSPGPGPSSSPHTTNLNFESHLQSTELPVPSFKFVGECYVHGLMDGEALDIMSLPPPARPEPLRHLSSGFEEIFIGGGFRGSEEVRSLLDDSHVSKNAVRKQSQSTVGAEEGTFDMQSRSNSSAAKEVF